ncbi:MULTISPECIES: hypothetical protein [Bartonella]|uniref:Uncharacterized protein n=1 Tax=Bartonella chomelii TaxID=236402 RepID=A0ABR6E2A2_9HYPH|nr:MULTISPECIES: hypothetical protein [Bartonella]MBA9082691.1 hypothetical protein [Bartonella chomelii]
MVKRREGLWMGSGRSVECTVYWVIGGYRLEGKRKGPGKGGNAWEGEGMGRW